jgi:hypothetical protein
MKTTRVRSSNRPFPVSTSRTIRTAGLLALLAGAASSQAAIFTFTPLCDNTWGTICNLAPGSCGVGGVLSRNNWAQTACNATPLFPGAADDVVFGVNGVLNNFVPNVRSVTINAGVSFALQNNMTTSNGFTNNGSVNTSGSGNTSYVGPFTNSGGATWVENSNTRFLAGVSFSNAGTLELQSIDLITNGGSNSYTNTGTLRKSGGSTASINVPVTNNGSIDVQAGGVLTIFSTTFTGSPTSTIAVAGGGAALNLSNYTLVGRINATGVGEINSSGTVTASGATIFNVASNLRISGNLNADAIPGSSFTNNNRVNTGGAGNLSYSGSITNAASGVWVENSNARQYTGCAFTNAGILELQTINLAANGGTNSITNSGTIRKTTGGTSTCNIALSNSGLIDVQAGTLDLNSLAYTGVGSGSVSVATGAACNFNTVTIGGTINFTGAGTLTSTGTLGVVGAASLNTTSAFRLLSNVTVNAGNSLTNRGLLSTSGAANLTYQGTLTNAATGTWIENSNNRFYTGASFVNNGIWELQSINLAANGGTNSLINNATMRKVGAVTATTDIPITNNATINVQGGTLNFNSTTYTAVPAANINVSSGATLNLNTMTLAGTVNCTGAGSFASTGTLTVSGNVTTTTTSPLQVLSNVTVNAGNSLTNQGLVSTSGAGNLTYVGPIVNGNNGTWIENSNNRFYTGASFVNNGIWELQSINLAANGGTNTLTNNATVRKTAAVVATTDIPFTNNAAFNVLDGTVNFNSTRYTGNGAAAFNISAPGTVNLNNMIIAGTLRATGNGAIGSGGTITASGNAIINTAQPFAMLGNIAAGGVGNSLTNAGSLSTSGAGNLTYVGAVTNTGTWVENSNNRFFTGMIFTNQGTLDVRSINFAANGGTNALNNSGTLLKTTPATFTTNLPLTNSGLIDVVEGTASISGPFTQSAPTARTLVRSGASITGSPLAFAGGRLEGRGSVGQAVTNSGATVAPGDSPSTSGTLTIGGTYTQDAAGTYEVSLFGRPNLPSDRILSNGNMSLAGALRVVITPPFLPKIGDVYEIARTNNTRTGVFSSVQVIGPSAVTVSVSYTPTTVLLTITGTECGSIDFNNDGSFFDPQDIDAFLSVFSEGPCVPGTATCNDIDFNNDAALFDPCDIDSFLIVFSEGPCTLCGV